MIRLVTAAMFLALNAYLYHFFAPTELSPPRESFDSFPLELEGWVCSENEPIPPEVARQLHATDTFSCSFQRFPHQPGDAVGVFISYYAKQVREGGGGNPESAIHLPKHCLPGSGWDVIEVGTTELDFPGLPQRPASVNRLVIAKGNQRQLTYYWYQSRGRVVAKDHLKMLYLFWDRTTKSRTDGGLVRFTVHLRRGDNGTAEAGLRELASQVVSRLPAYLPE
jgi:EpsI family protein